MTPQESTALVTQSKSFFPFALQDLAYWVVRRTDGTVVKYVVMESDAGAVNRSTSTFHQPHLSNASNAGFHASAFCAHNPSKLPVWSGERFDLYIADSTGTKHHFNEFDAVIDCADNITLTVDGKPIAAYRSRTLRGDPTLVDLITPTMVGEQSCFVPAKILNIDWADRQAPPLKVEAWKILADHLEGAVLCSCMGGHGRSGTALVCLLLVSNPAYSAKDAIIHLRAIHCPRAIESKVQHDYINAVAASLGRPADAHELVDVHNYKEAFMALPHKSAKPYQERLKGESKPV